MSARKDVLFPSYMLIDTLMYSADNDSYVTGWDKLSPALTLAGTGTDDGANYNLPARDDTLKRFRVSVASISSGSGPSSDKLMELDTANLYYGVTCGPNSPVPIGGTPSTIIGSLANGLPVKLQKVHFFASQFATAFKDGPVLDASATELSKDPAEYSCYMLCSSPVKVNRAPHPDTAAQDSVSEGAEQLRDVFDWMPTGSFNERLTIGGAPLTKMEVITGIERETSEPHRLIFKKASIYAAFPQTVTDTTFPFKKIEYVGSEGCTANSAYIFSDGAEIVVGEEAGCISDIYSLLDCICSGMSQLTGADGTYLDDCCNTTTTTATPCDPPGLLADKWYCITVLIGDPSEATCPIQGADFNSSYASYCPYTIASGPYDTDVIAAENCDCT